MAKNRHNAPPPPTQLRHLSDSEDFCTFADVKVRARHRHQANSQAT